MRKRAKNVQILIIFWKKKLKKKRWKKKYAC